ncbi:MAG: Hint domain-containing protein, partial [Pseudomonadota bacterium]
MSYTVNAYFLGSLSGDAGKEGSTALPVQITFIDENDDDLISEENEDLLEGEIIETMKDESILELENAGEVIGWYVEIEVGGELLAYFVPTDGTIPSVDELDEDIDLQGDQDADVSDLDPIVPCFTTGSEICTSRGCIPIEDLRVGDSVVTRDHG